MANYRGIMRPLVRVHRRSAIVRPRNCPPWAANNTMKAPERPTTYDDYRSR